MDTSFAEIRVGTEKYAVIVLLEEFGELYCMDCYEALRLECEGTTLARYHN
ncbi:hypothetical protein GGR09_000749 [Bartonella heixiaziensis]